jgi:CRP/FNR family cyclic AMP-dependent transcriptional regulator
MGVIPPLTDVLGWSAAALTLLAFSCNDLVRLRYLALSANAAFIAYGLTAQLWPVVAVHFVLVPINAWRLWQTIHGQREPLAQRPAQAST